YLEHRALDAVHDLVPLPLDVGEHRVGLAGQAGLADDADGLGHALGDPTGLVGGGGADADGDDHAATVARPATAVPSGCLGVRTEPARPGGPRPTRGRGTWARTSATPRRRAHAPPPGRAGPAGRRPS